MSAVLVYCKWTLNQDDDDDDDDDRNPVSASVVTTRMSKRVRFPCQVCGVDTLQCTSCNPGYTRILPLLDST